MVRVEQRVIINRPRSQVFAYTADLNNHPKFRTDLKNIRITSDGPVGKGTTYREVILLFGRQVEADVVITAYEPNKKLAFEVTSGPIPIAGSLTFEPAEGGVNVVFATEVDLADSFRLAEPLLTRMLQKQFETSLTTLKDLLEGHPVA
jgi:uncharacterized membrane protein